MTGARMAIVERLRSDPGLAALLGQFQGEPAVFAGPPIPAQRPVPYVAVDGELWSRPEGTKTHAGRRLAFPVKTVAAPDGRLDRLDRITEAIERALTLAPLSTDQWVAVTTEVSGPVPGPEPQSQVYNREQTVQLLLAAR
ncbi:MAG TPA: DUF3168 domain-containing protein [Acidimicrobiales bacterium]|nr:DUF3168 domain-containing protein [Acidimicrobiales bacterium]